MIVSNPEELAGACREIRKSSIIGVDTETNGLHAYRSRVCIIQVSDGSREWIIDALAFPPDGSPEETLAPMLDILDDPAILKILHGASHDVASLKEDYGRGIRNVFDTYVASQLLGHLKIGLSNLVEQHCGAVVSKKLQKADWGIRPLSAEACEYLRDDVRFLHRIHQLLLVELSNASLMEEAVLESRRIEETAATHQRFDPDGFWRMKGTENLADHELAFLRQLNIMRDRLALETDQPAFKTIPDSVLVQMAAAKSRSDLYKVSFLHKKWIKPHMQDFIAAFDETRNSKRPQKPGRQAPRRPPDEFKDRKVRDRLEVLLKDWRRTEAAARKVSTMAVLPNHLMEMLLASPPRGMDALSAIPHFGNDRLSRYGAKILEITSDALGNSS